MLETKNWRHESSWCPDPLQSLLFVGFQFPWHALKHGPTCTVNLTLQYGAIQHIPVWRRPPIRFPVIIKLPFWNKHPHLNILNTPIHKPKNQESVNKEPTSCSPRIGKLLKKKAGRPPYCRKTLTVAASLSSGFPWVETRPKKDKPRGRKAAFRIWRLVSWSFFSTSQSSARTRIGAQAAFSKMAHPFGLSFWRSPSLLLRRGPSLCKPQ